ncbi:unnamed protein product [Coffea canephora]|uniref:RING-type E3 ubiquitin transferase n=2 Tax=Coffea TaxID=13442 RepID=A0A068VDB0_COFCA|nr:E3 ubiquitin-protein ligase SINAT2-like [Coffea arabica]CDP17668.1 unnamed protein product [Coffea canephora]
MDASNSVLHNLLDCPVCMNTMFPPIRQCSNGHALCSNCKSRVNRCPICRDELGNIRCLGLEKLGESLEWPCKYLNVGCRDLLPYGNVINHELTCKFRPYNCPAVGVACPITGDVSFLVNHLKNDHHDNVFNSCTFNNLYTESDPEEVLNNSWKIAVYDCFGYQFCLCFEVFMWGSSQVYIAYMRFMGEPEDAKRFGYRLEVCSSGKSLSWRSIPRSIREPSIRVRESLDGLIIRRDLALFFSDGDKKQLKLAISGYICSITT